MVIYLPAMTLFYCSEHILYQNEIFRYRYFIFDVDSTEATCKIYANIYT